MIQKIINPFINDMRHFKNFWNQFWFGPVNLKGVSLFRFVFGIGVFFYYSITFLEYDIFFSDQGLIPYVHYYDIIPDFFLSPIPWHILTKKLLIGKILYVCYLFGLLSVAFGWLNRSIYWIVFILHLAFLKRNPFVIYGADLVGTCWLFYLCFVQANLYYRLPPIWKWFEQKSFSKYWNGAHSKTKKPQSDFFSPIGYRFIQIQLCVIYGYSGLEKAKGLTWWRGDALWTSLGNGQLVPYKIDFIAHFPILIALLTFITILWETFFPVLVWLKPLKKYFLLIGITMHVAVAFLVCIPFFSWFMLSSYILFWKDENI